MVSYRNRKRLREQQERIWYRRRYGRAKRVELTPKQIRTFYDFCERLEACGGHIERTSDTFQEAAFLFQREYAAYRKGILFYSGNHSYLRLKSPDWREAFAKRLHFRIGGES